MKILLACFILFFLSIAVLDGIYFTIAVTALMLVVVLIFTIFVRQFQRIEYLYTKLPTVWQDISETIDIAISCGVIRSNYERFEIYWLYRQLVEIDSLFVCNIDKEVVSLFEEKYQTVIHGLCTKENPLLYIKAVNIFLEVQQKYPERLGEITQAIKVKKVMGGVRPPRPFRFFMPFEFSH